MKIRNSQVESTPFAEISIKETIKGVSYGWIRLYWTANSGMYGRQVCAEYNHGNYNKNYSTLKTSGCGYSKECQALQDVLRNILGYRPYSCHYEANSLLRNYRKGGNYYELSISQLRKVCKAVK